MLGTARADRVPRQSAMERLKVPPDPPTTLTDEAKSEWIILAASCVDLGVLSGADLRALELLCEVLASEQELRALLQKEGMTIAGAGSNAKSHPAVKLLESTRNQAVRMLSDFGLTPRGRLGVEIRPPSSALKVGNPERAEKYFNGVKSWLRN